MTDLYERLKASGRGKHIYPFSYYHEALVDTVSGARPALLAARACLRLADTPFNVVKLDAGYRISFLLYEPFDVPFPALLASESCDLAHATVRRAHYAERSNPPILHRKELLLPADHPLVPEAASLTERLERQGAFGDVSCIGTRSGWQRRLAELHIRETGRPST